MNMPASGKRQKAGSSGQPGTVTLGALLIACCLLSVAAQAQKPTPAPPETRSILLKGGTVHAGDGTVIDDAAVGFRNGTIDFVGHSYGTTAKYDTVINTDGQHI
ncbi:MAG TPA: hypothetical protein PKL41_08380, partial [Flavobacteriales bacterium]|nr:hypothetical protein [Flavobacteriales bacterium]